MNKNFIKLVTGVKEDGTLETKTYLTQGFIPFRLLYEATDIMGGLEEKSEMEAMEVMLDFVVRIYDGQFTKDELLDGLESGKAVEEIQKQIEFIASGEVAKEKQAELKKLLK